jgi:hypothetical protein
LAASLLVPGQANAANPRGECTLQAPHQTTVGTRITGTLTADYCPDAFDSQRANGVAYWRLRSTLGGPPVTAFRFDLDAYDHRNGTTNRSTWTPTAPGEWLLTGGWTVEGVPVRQTHLSTANAIFVKYRIVVALYAARSARNGTITLQACVYLRYATGWAPARERLPVVFYRDGVPIDTEFTNDTNPRPATGQTPIRTLNVSAAAHIWRAVLAEDAAHLRAQTTTHA